MKILLVSFFFPPYSTIGAVRTGKLARFLLDHGHDVRVLAARDLPLLTSLKEEIPVERVHFTRWFSPNFLPELLFGGKKKIAQQGYKTGSGGLKKLSYYYRLLLHFPDEMIGWLPFARREGRKIIAAWQPDLIYASGKPFSTLMLAGQLSRATHTPWVAELRDLWTDNHDYEFPRWRQRLEAGLEKRTLSSAAGLVTVSAPWADLLREKYAKPTAVIYNGFDPADYPAISALKATPADELRLVYTGTFYPAFQNPAPLFAALKLLSEPERSRVRVRFYTRYIDALRAAAQEYGVEDCIEHPGLAPYRDALQAQMEADALLLFLWGKQDQEGWFPAKMFEYLGARRPILGIGTGKDLASELIRTRQAGVVSDQPQAIAAELSRLLAQKRASGAIPFLPASVQSGFSRAEQYETLLEFIQTICPGV